MSGCGYNGCEWEGVHRPYAKRRDNIPSASTIAKLADDQTGMQWAASMIAATTAIHHHDSYAGLSQAGCTEEKDGLCQACRYVRSQFDRQWKAKANLGTHVHHLIASLASGEEVDSDPQVDPYLDAWEAFVADCQPEWLELERTVRQAGAQPYRGTLDFIGHLTVGGVRTTWLGDWKSSPRWWPAQQTLQLAAYRYSSFLTHWKGNTEVDDKPMPKVDHAGVILLGDDGTYQLRELPADRTAHTNFMRLREVWNFQRAMGRYEKDHPEPTATNAEPVEAA